MDTWQYWLRIATDQVDPALKAHARLLEAHALTDDAAKGTALEDEFSTSMIALSAVAFALDAFYSAVKARAPIDPALEAAWEKNHTARPKRIVETLRRRFKIKDQSVRKLSTTMGQVFQFRNWAVHPPAKFEQALHHPDLNVGVEWRFIVFRADNCVNATRFALGVWCRSSQELTQVLVDAWTTEPGPAWRP
jgi:hypothetical protein